MDMSVSRPEVKWYVVCFGILNVPGLRTLDFCPSPLFPQWRHFTRYLLAMEEHSAEQNNATTNLSAVAGDME